jgi:methyltransferase (TIGR00027 family)
MQTGQPSRTAFGAASLRAAHQVIDRGAIFKDPLALRILGGDADDAVRRAAADDPARQRLRWFIAMRSRLADDLLAESVARGTTQLVVLGAGLDTTAYRTPFADRLRIFEVDHPATQLWKRERLNDAGIALPDCLRFVPVDFERETLADRLAASGFDAAQRTYVTWLGVVPYLSADAVFATLQFIAALPGGAEVVFDYAVPSEDVQSETGREARAALATRVSSLGEHFLSHFDPAALAATGFGVVENFSLQQLTARFFPARNGEGSPVSKSTSSAHVMHAGTQP